MSKKPPDTLKPTALPREHSLVILGIMLATSIGAGVESIQDALEKVRLRDPLLQALDEPHRMVVSVAYWVMASALIYKQYHIYYDRDSGTTGGAFAFTVGALTRYELNLDRALAVVSAGLWPVATIAPTLWFPLLTLYCVIGATRCRITLDRGSRIGEYEQGRGQHTWGVFWGNKPTWEGMEFVASQGGLQTTTMGALATASLSLRHVADFGTAGNLVSELIEGWHRGFRRQIVFSVAASMVGLFSLWVARNNPMAAVALVIVALCGFSWFSWREAKAQVPAG